MEKIKNRKTASKDEATGEMVKGGGDMAVDYIWRVCNMGFQSGVVPEDWRFDESVPLYKGKGERVECKKL